MVKLGIKKPVTTLMIVLAIILFAGVSLPRIPVELYPNSESGEVSVITRLRGGVAASEVEKYVTRPLEEVFSELNGLKELMSASRESESVIVLKFHHGINTDLITLDIREKLATIKHLLPRESEKPVIAKFQQFDIPIMIISLSSEERSPEQMRVIAEEKIKDKLMRVSGVANVEIGGGRERKLLIEVDNSKLIAYGLPILQVIERINLSNISVAAGDIIEQKSKYLIRITGEYNDIEQIRDTGIAITPAGSVIRLRDIATVQDSFYEATSFARLNVKSVVSLYIQKESSANTITVAKEVQQVLDNLKSTLQGDITITTVKNDADFINKAITSLETSLRDGAFLVSAILFLFLRDWRIILVIITILPLSLFISIILIYFTGLSFNVMTLSGLALGIGMLLDNAIVIIQNISFHARKKTFNDKESLVVNGTSEVILAIFASTISTIIVFLPLVFVDPEIRQMYAPFALTITFSLIAAFISKLLLLPVLCYRYIKNFELPLTPWYHKIEKGYLKALAGAYRYQKYLWILVVGGFIWASYVMAHKDSEFIDPGDANTFRVGIQFPPATRIERSNEIVKKMETALVKYPEVTRVSSKIEKLHTFLEVSVNKDPELFKRNFRKRFGEFSPAFIYYQESSANTSKEMFVDLFGYDYDTLKQIAFASSGRLQQVKELSDIKIRMREDEPEVHIFVDYDKLAMFGLTSLYFGNTLHAHMRGLIATYYRTEGKEIETICRLMPGSISTIKDLPFHSIINNRGDSIHIGQIADIKQTKATQEIWHKNKKRFIQISANRNKIGLTKAAEKIKKVLGAMSFPKDYSYNLSGDYEKTVNNSKQFSLAITLTIILIYLVLASLFESYTQPVLIMFTLPLSIIGVAFVLWLLKKPISLGVWIGLMILFGTAVNSAIIMVEKINTRREGKKNILRVVFLASQERLQAVIITYLNASLGLLPLVLSKDEAAEMWRSLSLTIIGGMSSSTVFTLFVIPLAYLALEKYSVVFTNFVSKIKLKFAKMTSNLFRKGASAIPLEEK